jgi:hypothetical protein
MAVIGQQFARDRLAQAARGAGDDHQLHASFSCGGRGG